MEIIYNHYIPFVEAMFHSKVVPAISVLSLILNQTQWPNEWSVPIPFCSWKSLVRPFLQGMPHSELLLLTLVVSPPAS